ncbi:uncharacterized protein LOC129239268 [Anastrepha obliqua]|uniref:uncharacterized protein LOC129239268 n=1 Tax=Anastrepha obliqua TaxID=95512 RepID=UPI0024094D48|nr:uncharacterized protein LOC129239268 [Anastrepha obliqua]XP_054730613.1 uncharacterized protein LOC129239268 [Anastrepha obliqua]XP_054730614.1 uncharacterized protein LOC129239268 [Anastrepha obliqua]XP_054730615.1 uncharacterized protein LOC129239268 [Anastrepha obliqua]XP_054730616.1 uncharacterized protein LOC129239268 [Anastrepha obliqua]XP_054730617.1 uncharacterized protein LOC129239268 [Anastrepha obliqua]
MDCWIRQTLLSENLDATSDCFKILSWLNIEYSGILTYKQIETILVCAAFVESCFEIAGDDLVKSILDKYTHDRLSFKEHYTKLNAMGVTLHSAARILATAEGYKHVYAVENILKLLKNDVSLLYNNKTCTKNLNANSSQFKMNLLVQRMFQLPPENIDIAIERLLLNCDFSLIGYIFLDPPSSLYVSKYKILEHKICKRISDGNLDPSFIRSMFVTVSNSSKGAMFFKSCLENKAFGNSLVTFFISYFQIFEKENVHLNSHNSLSEILCLVHCVLSSKSPARIKLYTTICKNETIARLINKKVFIYN